jgi:hypothetical protein
MRCLGHHAILETRDREERLPPPSHISDYDPRFFRTCTFPLLRRLGYGTRVTINNGLPAGAPFATPLALSLSAWDESGSFMGTTGQLAELQPGEIVKLEVESLFEQLPGTVEGDALGMFHLVPEGLRESESTEVATKELMAHMSSSDDFVEFHQKPKGVITGVAYQTGPLNDARFGSSRSTVAQAPKVIVSDTVDTLFCLMNLSTSFDYDNTVEMDFWILGPGGERITRAWVEVPPFTFRLVSAAETLARAGALDAFLELGGRGMFLGYSKNGTVVPLSLTRNQGSGAIACDHTLPPIFYLTTWGGETRLKANARLEQEFFSAPRDGDALPAYTAVPAAV